MPKINFILDYKKDITNALNFLNYHSDQPHYIENFLPRYLHFSLNKNFSQKERAKIIRAYTKDYHLAHNQEFKKELVRIKKDWARIGPRYYKLIDKLFKGHKWPKGEYKAIASIYNMFPRYIETKTFYFPPDHPENNFANKVIAHEMSHFIFFDYIKKRYKLNQDSKIKGKEKGYVWLVSEIFNYTIEQWEPYKKIFKYEKKSKPYFGNQVLCNKMKKDWNKKQDIDWLLDKWLK